MVSALAKFATALCCVAALYHTLQGVCCKWWCLLGQVDWLSMNSLSSISLINKLSGHELKAAVYTAVPIAVRTAVCAYQLNCCAV